MPLKDFVQYIDRRQVINLEKNFIILAKKEVTMSDKDIYITQESLRENFHKVFAKI